MQPSRIGTGDLIVDSWANLRRHAATYGEFAVWFAVLAAIRWALVTYVASVVGDGTLRFILNNLLSLPIFCLHAVLGIAAISAVSGHLAGRTTTFREAFSSGIHHFFSAVSVWIAGGLIFCLGLLMFFGGIFNPPGGIVFILPGAILLFPGIWLFVRYFFAAYEVVVNGMRSRAALRESVRIVAYRWWFTFVHVIAPWVFFYMAGHFVIQVLYLLIGSALGEPGLLFGQVAITQTLPNTYELIRAIVSETIEGGALPLYVASGILLWQDLKRSA